MRNDDTGWDIELSGASIRELVQFKADKINLIAELPAITKRAILADTRASERTQPSDSVIAFHTLYAPVSVDGVAGVARLVIRQDVNGKYAYDLQHSDILKSESTAEAVPSATPRIEGGASRQMTVDQLRDVVNTVDRKGWCPIP